MKNAKNARILWYFCPKKPFPQVLGAIPGSKAESERIRTNTQLRDHGGHRSLGANVLNKLSMRHLMLLYSISLDAQACDAVTKNRKFSNIGPK